MSKVLSIEELLERQQQIEAEKKQIKNKKEIEIYVEGLKGNVKVKVPEMKELKEIIEGIQDDAGKEDEMTKKFLYQNVTEPNLKDSRLRESFKCAEPYDIIDKLFTEVEQRMIAELVMREKGLLSDVHIVKQVKN